MKRITLWALSLVLVAGALASTATAFEPILQEKTVYEGTPRRSPGSRGRRPHYSPGRGGSHRGYYDRRHRNNGLGLALGAAVGTAIGSGIANSGRYSQPTMVCDAYGNCYYR
ncbi:MAG: hypothetical protein LUC93_08775 [Planctomycetaceae bacterium]|nr:hypothetical protein [Planctomycetaceae bacterium]